MSSRSSKRRWSQTEKDLVEDLWRGPATAAEVAKQIKAKGGPHRSSRAINFQAHALGLQQGQAEGLVPLRLAVPGQGFGTVRNHAEKQGYLLRRGRTLWVTPQDAERLRVDLDPEAVKGWLTCTAAARCIGICESTAMKWARDGRLTHKRLGANCVLFDPSSVDEMRRERLRQQSLLKSGALLTVAQAAILCGRSTSLLQRDLALGRLVGTKSCIPGRGRSPFYLVQVADLEAWQRAFPLRRSPRKPAPKEVA